MLHKRRIKRVLLVTPPAFTFKNTLDINPIPLLGPAYLASVLEGLGIEVRIYDSLIEGWETRQDVNDGLIRIGSSYKEIEDLIRNFNPDMVGVSNLFSRQYNNAHKIYEIVKNVSPDIITVAGGAHPSALPFLVMQDKNVDFVIIGEGEKTIQDLIEHLENKKPIEDLDGIAFRRDNKPIVISKKYFIENLDSLPFPARHLLNMNKYFGLESSHGRRRHKKFSPLITSRGCPAKCIFCSAHCVWGRQYRSRSIDNIIKEMYQLKNEYGIKELMFEDDNVTLDIARASRLFDAMIEEKLNFDWDTPNGVAAFALNNDLIAKMKDAGCYKLNIAVESGNQRVLSQIIKKPLNLKKVESLVKFAKRIGLEVGIFLILGLPGETIENMKESLCFAQRLGIYDPFISIATPYPGSDLYKLCLEKGYISNGYDFDKLFITSFSISTENWKSEDVKRVYRRGYLSFKRHFYIRHPFLCLKEIIKKLFSDPFGLIEKIAVALKGA